MAILMADGFDWYGAMVDITYVGAPWISAGAFTLLSTTVTPYGAGQSIDANAAGTSASVTFSNEPTIYFTFDMYPITNFTGTSANGLCITLNDGGTAQVTLQWAMDGKFYVRAGGTAGAILNGTGFVHGMAPSSWVNWQAKVVINNTTGSVELRKNNNSADDYSITNINTRNGTTNNYANSFTVAIPGINTYLDNLFVNSASGAAPTSWPGQVRAVQLMPNADTATKALTPSSGTPAVYGINSTLSSQAYAANTIYWTYPSITFPGGTLSNVILKLASGFTGHMKCAVYQDVGNFPTTLIAQTVEITNPIAGDNTFTFTSPPTLLDNTVYWLGFWSDTAFTPNTNNVANGNNKSQALTYAANFPATASSGNATLQSASVRATESVSNYGMTNELIENGDTDYVFGSVAGNVDLYAITPLTTVPAGIVAVATKNFMRKSDTGARTATTEINSGGLVQDQATLNLAVTYQWQTVYFPTDPNTGATWTFAGVNALLVGPKIVA